MDVISINKRKDDFFAQLDLSNSTIRGYKQSINSGFLKEILQKEFGGKQLFEITDIEELWKLYSMVNLHPKNICFHRTCSATIMRYIKYLN